ncbi:acyl-CoA reductase-like NAD-dependent aldehyde dehydrogenase [Rhizobium sp. BK347]|uniref:Aldehyde dehydrogenase domain-containing protein n=1 Tax=Rhizobium tropici TaxID=398 RepID=A0A329YIZ7_RHITR|nr:MULTISPECIES: aldehyde dehydrogenase family protein [Rhizobium]MBB3291085.1 acyl-CoA reductase-like NAD-dependent aldehyde dehydrogenase [Rhizobium sp. BK252]MBB3405864.1 acyl-CoA reductase-like NAD-dependent aldehyde dehydrogenase [Rhizobium sp. BK289]MBB3418412.1 acyl-CoA reductase-like NAD-dependent aldehyde dehydrogenase [Rhizobium sp. BK284]MBB3486290.1 acyl-CoA reductase-like NAD-dependent aldehyde dehydrogenase [Rhizobium sp. BK347]RAX43203.1 hypothetical protein DQ393_01975 [Rhizobi
MKLADPSLFRQSCPVSDLGAAETEEAIRSADIAKKLQASKTAGERAPILKASHCLMIENRDDLATTPTLEQGNPWPRPKWDRRDWPQEALAALNRLKEIEPNGDIRNRIEDLLAKKEFQ